MKLSLFYDHVTILDYAYLDQEYGPVGDSLVVNVEFVGRTDDEGVIYDFSYAKKKVKEIIDRDCDHRLVVPQKIVERDGDRVLLNCKFAKGELEYSAPDQAICEIPYDEVTTADLTTYLEEIVLKEMPENIEKIILTLEKENTPANNIYFHYTHGLKDHYGNCQRLLHGHRSTFKLIVDGVRDVDGEIEWVSEHLTDKIHFAFWENVVNREEIYQALGDRRPVGRHDDLPNVILKYSGNQGDFQLVMNSSLIYFMDMETTVENLSSHFCHEIKEFFRKGQKVEVHAFEGIGKGAKTILE